MLVVVVLVVVLLKMRVQKIQMRKWTAKRRKKRKRKILTFQKKQPMRQQHLLTVLLLVLPTLHKSTPNNLLNSYQHSTMLCWNYLPRNGHSQNKYLVQSWPHQLLVESYWNVSSLSFLRLRIVWPMFVLFPVVEWVVVIMVVGTDLEVQRE